MQADCLFCRIIAGEIPSTIVYQDDQLTAIRDVNPQAPTHILLLPRRHVAGVDAAGPEDVELLGTLLVAGARLAAQEGLASGYRLVINNGRDAGQSVFHLHVHLLGGRPLQWPPG